MRLKIIKPRLIKTNSEKINSTISPPAPYSKPEKCPIKKNTRAIRKLVKEQDIINGENPHYIASVDSGSVSTKLTFRFWLEGWDADCFDGISQSIRVNLSFGSFKNGIKSVDIPNIFFNI